MPAATTTAGGVPWPDRHRPGASHGSARPLADHEAVHLPVGVVNPQLGVVLDILLHHRPADQAAARTELAMNHRRPGTLRSAARVRASTKCSSRALTIRRRDQRREASARAARSVVTTVRGTAILAVSAACSCSSSPGFARPDGGRRQGGQLVGGRPPGIAEEQVTGRAGLIRRWRARRNAASRSRWAPASVPSGGMAPRPGSISRSTAASSSALTRAVGTRRPGQKVTDRVEFGIAGPAEQQDARQRRASGRLSLGTRPVRLAGRRGPGGRRWPTSST